MPNRVIKESAFSSEKISALSDFEFRLWVGLITQADDFGRGDARPAIIKGRVFPLRDRVTVKDIDAAVHGLAAKGCISLYTVGGKSYFWFPAWSEHQRIRNCLPKYPGPEESDNPPQVAASCGESRPESNPYPNPKKERSPSETKRKNFAPPSVEEVRAYCLERKNGIDPQAFVDFYASKGWMVGKNAMKDWRAAVRTWEAKRRAEHPVEQPQKPAAPRRYHLETVDGEEVLVYDD